MAGMLSSQATAQEASRPPLPWSATCWRLHTDRVASRCRQSRGGERGIRSSPLHSAFWSRIVRALLLRLPAPWPGEHIQHPRDCAEARIPRRCAAVCGDRGAMQVFALQRALAAMRAMDCLLVEPLDLQMLE